MAGHTHTYDGDDAYEALRASVAAPDLEEAIRLLEDEGLATFRRARR